MITIQLCPLCGCKKSKEYYHWGAPERIPVYNRVCSTCGLVFQSPRQDYEDLKKYYADYFKKMQPELANIPRGFEDHALAISRVRLEFLKHFLRQGDRILDIGCSFGATLKILRDESGLNLEVMGINPEPHIARFGQEKFGLDIRIGMFEDVHLTPDSFDLIILDNVIEHFDNPRKIVAAIYNLLRENGRIFIVTNNLDDPHGFLWQNFFLDHTVTFSPNTLRCLLEAEGFRKLKSDTAGHVTYEGYHYPYQYCIAEKDKKPVDFDFKFNGDSDKTRITQAKKYQKIYLKQEGIRKQLFEIGLKKKKTVFERTFQWIFQRPICPEQKNSWRLFNHTLPPEKYFIRRVLVAECSTDQDVALAFRLAYASGLNPLKIILRQKEGQIILQSFDTGIFSKNPPNQFSSEAMFWAFLHENGQKIYTLIAMRLENADLPETALDRSFKEFSKTDLQWAIADYRSFTNARWEFLSADAFTDSTGRYSTEGNLLPFKSQNRKEIIWPDREDYHYFFVDQFNKYYSHPKGITLDLHPGCDKKCDKCQFHSNRSPYSNLISRDQQMPLHLALKIIDEICTWDPKPALYPTYSGEPLLYPSLETVLKYATSKGVSVSVTTNGMALNYEKSLMLLDSGIESLVISLDASTEETYHALQSPGNLKQIHENILQFLELRGIRKKPQVGVHFVMDECNQEEFNAFLQFWSSRIDYVSRAIKQDQFSYCQPVLTPWLNLGRRQACHAAWTTLLVRWDGAISFCGFDISGQSDLNVNEQTLKEIWNSSEFWRWRKAQLEQDRKIIFCKACPDWSCLRSYIIKEREYTIVRSPITETYYKVNNETN